MTPRAPKGFGTGGQRFGTGADPETVVKNEGPGFFKTILGGIAFGTGLLIVSESYKALKNAWNSSDDDDSELDQIDEESGFSRRDYYAAHDRRENAKREARIRKLERELEADEED